jgi:hypothetical protein
MAHSSTYWENKQSICNAEWGDSMMGFEIVFSGAGNWCLKRTFSKVGRREGVYVIAYNEAS